VDLRRSILLTVFLAGVCAVLSGALWQLRVSAGDPGADTPGAAPAHAETEALGILRAWDLRRARAWAAGDVHALDKLYTPRSKTGAVDHAMLRSYVRRGLVVEGMATQVLAADLGVSDATHLTLVVTDSQRDQLCARPWMVGAGTTAKRLAVMQQFGEPAVIHENHFVGAVIQRGVYFTRQRLDVLRFVAHRNHHRKIDAHAAFFDLSACSASRATSKSRLSSTAISFCSASSTAG